MTTSSFGNILLMHILMYFGGIFDVGRSTQKKFMTGLLLWVAPHTEAGEQSEEEGASETIHVEQAATSLPHAPALPTVGGERIGSEGEPKKRGGLVLFGIETVFFVEALMVLLFVFVNTRALIIDQCFTHRNFLPPTLPHRWGGWGCTKGWEVIQRGQLTPGDPRVSHTMWDKPGKRRNVHCDAVYLAASVLHVMEPCFLGTAAGT